MVVPAAATTPLQKPLASQQSLIVTACAAGGCEPLVLCVAGLAAGMVVMGPPLFGHHQDMYHHWSVATPSDWLWRPVILLLHAQCSDLVPGPELVCMACCSSSYRVLSAAMNLVGWSIRLTRQSRVPTARNDENYSLMHRTHCFLSNSMASRVHHAAGQAGHPKCIQGTQSAVA